MADWSLARPRRLVGELRFQLLRRIAQRFSNCNGPAVSQRGWAFEHFTQGNWGDGFGVG